MPSFLAATSACSVFAGISSVSCSFSTGIAFFPSSESAFCSSASFSGFFSSLFSVFSSLPLSTASLSSPASPIFSGSAVAALWPSSDSSGATAVTAGFGGANAGVGGAEGAFAVKENADGDAENENGRMVSLELSATSAAKETCFLVVGGIAAGGATVVSFGAESNTNKDEAAGAVASVAELSAEVLLSVLVLGVVAVVKSLPPNLNSAAGGGGGTDLAALKGGDAENDVDVGAPNRKGAGLSTLHLLLLPTLQMMPVSVEWRTKTLAQKTRLLRMSSSLSFLPSCLSTLLLEEPQMQMLAKRKIQ